MNKQRVHLLALSLIPGFGPKTILKIINLYPDIEKFWSLSKNDLRSINLRSDIINSFITGRNLIDPYKEESKVKSFNLDYITIIDKEYPKLLKEIYDPPIVLYCYGNKNSLDLSNKLAVVGTRKISSYAKQILPKLLLPIIKTNIVIVSGLAVGVDGLSHQIAVDNNQPTIAVLGSGVDWPSLYPKQHYNLARNIINNNGIIISEYPPGTASLPENFPRRNRIISGLCQATLIVEAANRSGSLITAYQALEQNRELMAIPGSIHLTNSQGTNKLIQQGAKLISTSNDILETYQIQTQDINKINSHLNKIEKQIVKLLQTDPLTVDKLSEYSKIDIVTLNATLSMLEIKGVIKASGSCYYSI